MLIRPAALLIAGTLCCAGTSNAETPFEAAQPLIESGQFTEARRALEHELAIRPDNRAARYNLALLLEESGHIDDAINLYRENLNDHWHLPSLVNLVSALQRQENHGEAESWLTKGTKSLRHEATPWYLLATIREQQGNISTARKLFRKALNADPLNGFATIRYASFQSRHKLSDRGLRLGAKAVRLLPDCAPCWDQFADILIQNGHHNRAVTALQRSLAIEPALDKRLKLISTLRSSGQIERAKAMELGINYRKAR